jgi:putative YjhG/YagF family dehydratase
MTDLDPVLDSGDDDIDRLITTSEGPAGRLPLDAEMLRATSSGNLFGWTQNVAMGLSPTRLRSPEYLIISTQGGLRGPDGEAVALGYHTGHWEIGLLVEAAAREMSVLGAVPFAGAVSDPCDGRTNGTAGMLDSLPYRNDAAIVMRRLIRSLPTCRGILGIASCDKGLPATLMALAGVPSLPAVAVPGGVTLLARDAENTALVQTLSARFARGEVTLDHASVMGCRACGSAGGGCQFMGTAATSQVIAEALGLSLPHSALSPSGTAIWLGMARRSATALHRLANDGVTTADILSDDAIHNAMVLHAAVGGSTNILLHLPAIAHAAGLDRPSLDDWVAVNAAVPRLVDALPNGPQHFATVQVFLAGGVPEVMLQLAGTGALRLDARTVSGRTLGDNLSWWETSERRRRVRDRLAEVDGIDPDDVIRPLDRSLPSTVTFLTGSIAPGGAVVKSTAIAPHLLDDLGIYHHRGDARVFTSEDAAIDAIKQNAIEPGQVLVLMGLGPGIGMPETYQITAALKAVDPTGRIPLITDGRFSGVSTGPCIGHISPEAWAGGPIGKLRDGDLIDIHIDTANNIGRVDVLEPDAATVDRRALNDELRPDPRVPDDTRLWAALQAVGGGSWGGCVYDVDRIVAALGHSPHEAAAPR